MEYEFTLVGDMDVDHKLVITKSRCDMMADKVQLKPGIEFWMPFVEWLDSGDAAPVAIKKLAADKRNLKDVLEWADEKYGVAEDEAKQIMKDGGMTSYRKPTLSRHEADFVRTHSEGVILTANYYYVFQTSERVLSNIVFDVKNSNQGRCHAGDCLLTETCRFAGQIYGNRPKTGRFRQGELPSHTKLLE